MNELATGAGNNAQAMQELGFTFEDSVSLFGSLDKAGIDATATMGAMKKGMLNLAQPGESTADAFKRVTGELQGYIDAGDTGAALDMWQASRPGSTAHAEGCLRESLVL